LEEAVYGKENDKPQRKTTSAKSATGIKRPSQNPVIPQQVLSSINTDLKRIKAELDEYAAHLRPLDRRRLNGVGLKIEGFIDRSFALAVENPDFLPKYLTTEKLVEDHQ
jgi:hypothetical protein